jgi:hypothetical protein
VEISFHRGRISRSYVEDVSRRIAVKREMTLCRNASTQRGRPQVCAEGCRYFDFDCLLPSNQIIWSDELRTLFDSKAPMSRPWTGACCSILRTVKESRGNSRSGAQPQWEYKIEFRVKPSSSDAKFLLGAGEIIYMPDERQRMRACWST